MSAFDTTTTLSVREQLVRTRENAMIRKGNQRLLADRYDACNDGEDSASSPLARMRFPMAPEHL